MRSVSVFWFMTWSCLLMRRVTSARSAECALNRDLTGIIRLEESGSATWVSGEIQGLSDGPHGFHVHEKASLDCPASGSHYNPSGVVHGDLGAQVRHAGDMGNILVTGGVAKVNITVQESLTDLVNRTIVVHELEDDLGLGTGDQLEGSQKTGNAGARLDCCITRWTSGATSIISTVSVTLAVISAVLSSIVF